MSKAKMGACVRYCGHDATFVADVWRVGNVNIVVANGPITDGNQSLLTWPAKNATHHLVDYPEAGYWNPRKGIFVVPEKQVKEIKR